MLLHSCDIVDEISRDDDDDDVVTNVMKCYDFVSQHAVNLFLEPLRSVCICE